MVDLVVGLFTSSGDLIDEFAVEQLEIANLTDTDIQTAAETMRLKAIKCLTEARLAAQQQ